MGFHRSACKFISLLITVFFAKVHCSAPFIWWAVFMLCVYCASLEYCVVLSLVQFQCIYSGKKGCSEDKFHIKILNIIRKSTSVLKKIKKFGAKMSIQMYLSTNLT